MKPEDLMDAMNNLDDELISSAAESRVKRNKKNVWIKWVAVAACFSLLTAGIFGHFNYQTTVNGGLDSTPPSSTQNKYNQSNNSSKPIDNTSPVVGFMGAVYKASYPACVPYPNESDFFRDDGTFRSEDFDTAYDAWLNDLAKRTQKKYSTDTSVGTFSSKTVKNIFANSNGENLVYSPVNLYIALSMLAETTAGETRTQILNLLGVSSIEYLRNCTNEVWNNNYYDDGLKTSILANSVWLNNSLDYNKTTLQTLAEKYFASSFSGEMGSAEYDEILQKWINEQTGNQLKNEASQLNFDKNTVLSLVSTVYFNAGWQDEFDEFNTRTDVFNSVKGTENAKFMYQRRDDILYSGNGYSAVYLNFNRTGKMWFILPDEGKTPESILQSGAIDTILNGQKPKTQESCFIKLNVPKFDITSSLDLKSNLSALGVTNVFDYEKSDFSPMIKNNIPTYLSKVNHSVRVSVNEKGCTAAAFTAMMLTGTGVPEEKKEIEFTLDRPFIFVVSSDDKTPLFVGTVNHIN